MTGGRLNRAVLTQRIIYEWLTLQVLRSRLDYMGKRIERLDAEIAAFQAELEEPGGGDNARNEAGRHRQSS